MSKRLAAVPDVSWALLDQAIVSGASFLTGILIARFLGLDELGRFVLASVALFLAQNLQGALVTGPMLTVGSAWNPAERNRYLGAVLIHQGAFSLIASISAWLALHLLDALDPAWGLSDLAAPVAWVVGAGTASDMLRHYFYSVGRSRASFLLDLLRYGLQIIILLTLFGAGWIGVAGTLHVMAMTATASFALAWMVTLRPDYCHRTLADVGEKHAGLARWMFATASVGATREAVVNIAVGACLGLQDLGLLRAAQQVVLAVNVPLQGLGKLAQAGASRAYAEQSYSGLDRFMWSFVARYASAIAIVLCLVSVASEPLIVAVYGPAAMSGAWVLSAYALVMILHTGREAIGIRLRAMRRPALEFYGGMSGAVVSMIAIVPLITGLGLAGMLLGEALFTSTALGVTLYLAMSRATASREADVSDETAGMRDSRRATSS
ncbi:MAG: hypothetical protein NW216_02995 [Hyphomicrobium sp.]|nr:hypothetical protein [Hyphomicrobium sp.]